MSHILALLALTSSLAGTPTSLTTSPVDSGKPIVMTSSDLTPVPGEVVSYTVSLSSAASSAGYLSISSSTMSNFATLPSEAPYATGDTAVTFSGTIANTASGSIQLSASSSAGSVSLISMLAMQTDSTQSILNSVRF